MSINTRIGKLISLAFTLVLAACGDERPAAAQGAGAAEGGSGFCPGAQEVGQLVGFPVRVLREGTRSFGPAEMCAYEGTEARKGTFVSLSVEPAGGEEDPIRGVKESAKTWLGARAEAEPIEVGDGGVAFGSSSQSEAAARKGDRVYRAQVGAMTGSPGDKKEAMIALLRRAMK